MLVTYLNTKIKIQHFFSFLFNVIINICGVSNTHLSVRTHLLLFVVYQKRVMISRQINCILVII